MGSGKSHISKAFAKNGIPVYDCDSQTKDLLNRNERLKSNMISAFGEGCYVNGKYSRDYIVELASKNPNVVDDTGKIIGPYLIEDFKTFKEINESFHTPFIAIESAILTKSKKLMNEINKLLVVTAPFEIRMDRIKKRDPFRTDDEIKLLLSKQPEIKLCEIDFLIDNDGTKNVDDAVVTIINGLIP